VSDVDCYNDRGFKFSKSLMTFHAPIFIATARCKRYDGEYTDGARRIDKAGRVILRSVMLFVNMTLLLSCFWRF
jgi:hypothetical protein